MLDKLVSKARESITLGNTEQRLHGIAILRLVRVARAAKAILAHHDEGARPDQIALDELRAALKETT
jgi:hypothetical protein